VGCLKGGICELFVPEGIDVSRLGRDLKGTTNAFLAHIPQRSRSSPSCSLQTQSSDPFVARRYPRTSRAFSCILSCVGRSESLGSFHDQILPRRWGT